MVKTKEQYAFLYECLLKIAEEPKFQVVDTSEEENVADDDSYQKISEKF